MTNLLRHRLTVCAFSCLASWGSPAIGAAQPTAAYRAWARTHAHTISAGDSAKGTADLRALDPIVGDARVVAIAEPFHMGHEPLAVRNRIIRYLVAKRGFTAVALETGLTQSKTLYDYVLGRTPDADSVIRAGFTYGFGALGENVALLKWLRAFNASHPASRQVHLYGIDLPGQMTSDNAAAFARVLDYLDRADPALGARMRAEYATIVPRFTGRRFVTLPEGERDLVTGKVHDLTTLLRRKRIAFTRATSPDEYEWALRQAVNLEQDAAFNRLVPSDFFPWLDKFQGGDPTPYRPEPGILAASTVRELSMAENVAWALGREGSRGRLVSFAHDAHQQMVPHESVAGDPLAPLLNGLERAGNFARATLGKELVTIGTYFGAFAGEMPGPIGKRPDGAGAEALFGSLDRPAYVADLRAIPATGELHDFLSRKHETRLDLGMHRLAPMAAYDAILYIDRITPANFPK